MISCTEFIPVYSELFKFIEKKSGYAGVVEFWEYLSDNFLGNLRDTAAEKGLAGCYDYWGKALTEEAADFCMTLNEDESEFTIEMRGCPSKGRLLAMKDIEPYHAYCDHCDTLYRRVLEAMGYDYDINLTQCEKAKCKVIVRRKK